MKFPNFNLNKAPGTKTEAGAKTEQSPAMNEALAKLQTELGILKTVDSNTATTEMGNNPAKKEVVLGILGNISEMSNTITDIAGQLKDNPKIVALMLGVTSIGIAGGMAVANPEGWKLAVGQILVYAGLLAAGVLGAYGSLKEAK